LGEHVAEHVGAQVEDETLAEARRQPALRDRDARAEHGDERDGE